MPGHIQKVKVTRVDLYSDVVLPESCWLPELKDYFVTRACLSSLYFQGHIFSGFSFGRGQISARLYDKPLEIKKSHKLWMYKKWGIDKVLSGFRIIRVEFQLRRTAIKGLGISALLLRDYMAFFKPKTTVTSK